MKPVAYSKDFLARLAAGESIDLLVVSVRDWDAGHLYANYPRVARVVIGTKDTVLDVDLAIVRGFDCLVIGGEDADFFTAARLMLAHGAASVWGSFADGFCRLESARMMPGVVSVDQLADFDTLLDELPVRREVRLILGTGIYAAPAFRPARIAAYGRIFGAEVAAKLQARAAA